MEVTKPRRASLSPSTAEPVAARCGNVFIVIGENSAYGSTFNSGNMPYLTSLASQCGLSTKYWADTHPSVSNYEVMTAGQILTTTDSRTPPSLPVSSDNIAMEVEKAGKTWKDYFETGNGCGAVNSGTYYVRHDPREYFTNINSPTLFVSANSRRTWPIRRCRISPGCRRTAPMTGTTRPHPLSTAG